MFARGGNTGALTAPIFRNPDVADGAADEDGMGGLGEN